MARSRLAISLVFLGVVTACGPSGTQVDLPGQDMLSTTIYGPNERRIAASLSIGALPALANDSSPYQQALLCTTALENLGARLRGTSMLDPRAAGGLREAVGQYEAQIARLAAESGKSADAIASDRQAAKESVADDRAWPQIGVGCLRKLVPA